MPPTDNTTPPAAAPEAPQQPPKKLGFWAKLFGKKETPAAPAAASSLTPEPRLDEPAGQVSQPVAPVAPAPVAPSAQPSGSDQQTGPVESTVTDVHDTDGNIISPSLAVPDNLQNHSIGKNPTLPVAPAPQQPAQQAPAQPPVQPQQQPFQPGPQQPVQPAAPQVPPAGPQPPVQQ